jgi:hypothetical protein
MVRLRSLFGSRAGHPDGLESVGVLGERTRGTCVLCSGLGGLVYCLENARGEAAFSDRFGERAEDGDR